MKTDSDLDRLTADWLKEGSRPLPTRVRDAALSTVAETRQLSPAAPRWSIRLRQAMAVSVAAAAAVLAVGVGINLLSSFGVGVGPSSRPSPSHHPHPSTDSSPSVGASASPAPTRKIAFTTERDGNPEIFVMNADGSGQTNVSHGPAGFGAWSPDGSRIAFTSDRDGNVEVYVVNADGSGLTRLSNDPCTDGVLAWSPDGSRIAFISGGRPPFFQKGDATPPPAPAGCPSTIYVVNADGSGLTNLTNGLGDDGFGAWSPDGARISFTSDRDGDWEIYIVNADGSGLTNLSNNPGFDQFEGWSSDSSRVRFHSECKVMGGPVDVYEVNIDGSGLTDLGHQGPIFNGGTLGCAPSDFGAAADYQILIAEYSPDGARIAFTSGGDGGLYVMNADFSGITRLVNGPAGNPVWSPDGSRIAFGFGRDVYLINADGSGLTNLTNSPGDYRFDFWFADSSGIVFGSDRDGNHGEIYAVNADGSGLTNLSNNPGNDYDPVWSPAL